MPANSQNGHPILLTASERRQFVRTYARELAMRQPIQYKLDAPLDPMAVGQLHHEVGETKVFNGKTYRLNERHRWELANDTGASTERAGREQGASRAPSLDDHKQFAAGQLGSIDKSIGGLFRAFHQSKSFKSGGQFLTHDVAPEQAEGVYQTLKQNAGQDWGGGQVVDLGGGRIGFSSPAGAMTMQPPQTDGEHWQTQYTVMTGPVARAMGGDKPLPKEEGNAAVPDETAEPTETEPASAAAPEKVAAISKPPEIIPKTIPPSQLGNELGGVKQTNTTQPAQPPKTRLEQLKSRLADKEGRRARIKKADEDLKAARQQFVNRASEIGKSRMREWAATQKTGPQSAGESAISPEASPAKPAEPALDHLRLRDTATKLKQRLGEAMIAHDDALRSGDSAAAKSARQRVAILRTNWREADRNAKFAEQEHEKAKKASAPEGRPYHEMPREEFAQYAPVSEHKRHLKEALAAGKKIPAEVLKDYPELQGQSPAQPEVSDQPDSIWTNYPQVEESRRKELEGLGDDELRGAAKVLGIKGLKPGAPRTALLAAVAKGMFGTPKTASTQQTAKPAAGSPAPAPEAASRKLWSLLKEGRQAIPLKTSFIPQALKLLEEERNYQPAAETTEAVPFDKSGVARHYVAVSPEGIREAVKAAAGETDVNPSDAAREAGNYRKGKCRIHGLEIAIETPKGVVRSGTNRHGKTWSTKMPHHYGYIKNTESEADGDHMDVFLGPMPEQSKVFVVDQLNHDGDFDEHKIMLGYPDEKSAKEGYLAAYPSGWKGFGAISPMSMDELKEWITEGDSAEPVAERI